ncbi:MAG: GDSL-type esterase/lipase family protein [Myxococcota bacterium]
MAFAGLRRVSHSPLAVVGLAVGALAAWSWGYEALAGGTVAEAEEAPSAGESAARAAAAEPHGGLSADEWEASDGPRLLRPPRPDERYGLPVAIEGGGSEPLQHFHQALERAAAGEGQARILFYGASHVASDTFTGPLRVALQQRYGDAGHGFVLPVHPWRSYRHMGVEIESNPKRWETLRIRAGASADDVDYYGLAGMAVETDRRGAFGEVRTAARGSVTGKASQFEVFYLKQPDGGELDVKIDGRRVGRIQTAAEAAEPGYATFRVEDGSHALRLEARGNGKVRVFGVAVERERPGVVLDTLGINGARARYHLLWEDSLYRQHLVRRDPDLAVLAYGTNESGDDQPLEDYERELRQVVARVRETVPQASCLLIGPSDRPVVLDEGVYEDRPRTARLNAIQRRVAIEHGCGYFDLLAFQGGPLSMVEWAAADPPYGQADHIHFTIRGYRRLGDVMLEAFLEGFSAPGDDPAATTASAAGAGGD